MKLAFLNIERFGARSDLQLDDLSQQLNVVYGPNGSGKTTIINFIRWVLFGQQDASSRQYLSPADTPAGGSLKVLDGEQSWRIVSRHEHGSSGGRVSVADASGDATWRYDPTRLTGVDLEEYQHIFSFGFDQPPAVAKTIRIAAARGFDLAFDEQQVRRVQELAERLAEMQGSYHSMPEREDRLPILRERHRQIQSEIESIEQRRRLRLAEIEREREELRSTVSSRKARLAELEVRLKRTEDRMALRRNQLHDIAQESIRRHDQTHTERQRQIVEIDDQIQQWQDVLSTIRDRLQHVQQRIGDWKPALSHRSGSERADMQHYLRSVDHHMDDLEEDMRDLNGTEDLQESRADSDYLRSVLTTAVKSMRDEVHRLAADVQRQQASAACHEHARELQRLKICESELADLIGDLSQRRDSLLPSDWMTLGSPSIARQERPAADGGTAIRRWGETASLAADGHHGDYRHEEVQPNDSDPVLEAHLMHLTRRHDRLSVRVRELQHQVSDLERRLEPLQSGSETLDTDRQLEAARRELAEITRSTGQAEQRQRYREQIDALQHQIDELRSTLGPSTIIQEASSVLQRMTEGAYRRLRVTDLTEIWVDDAEMRPLAYGELSRGTRDQVYLSICLALAAAYYRRGVELPLILNDIFINIDADRAQATATLLEEFSSHGHQIVLFTRHEHVLQLFPNSRGRRFKLQQRNQRPETTLPRSSSNYLDQISYPDSQRNLRPPVPTRGDRTHDWVAQWDHSGQDGSNPPAQENVRAPQLRQTFGEDTPLSQIESFDSQLAARLQDINVHTLRMFLNEDPNELSQRLAQFNIAAAMIHRDQSEMLLQCYVGLAPSDAGLLVACGVDDPQELAYIDVTELHRRIEDYLSREANRSQFGGISRFERSRLSRWIQSARQSRFRRQRTPRRTTGWRTAIAPILSKQADLPAAMDTPSLAASETDSAPPEPHRFYLELSDPVVDAPSIGPKTAERFHAIDTHTIADLLALDPEVAADKINYRRITPSLIREWQTQTQLVCRIPNLRGHDAQILVACDVTQPAQLAGLAPRHLHESVNQFVRSSDGKRILRNGKKPDLAEVTAWIRWAENSRELEAAR